MIMVLIAGLLGACIGSFLHALAFRVYEGWTLQGRSKCPHCQTTIRPRHLIPVLSWVALRGRCATCRKRIHILYPIAECVGGGVWALIAIRAGVSVLTWPMLTFFFLFFSFLLFLALFDARYQRLPTELMVVGALVFGGGALVLGLVSWQLAFLGMCLGLFFFGIQVVLSDGAWMGSGDPVLGALIGLVLGWQVLAWGIYFTYTISAFLFGCLWLLRVVHRRSRIAFAPLLCGGVFVAWYMAPYLEQVTTRLLG